MPYPTEDEVRSIVSGMFSGGHPSGEGIQSVMTDTFEGSVAGRHFSLGSSNLEGPKAWLDELVNPINDARDTSKPGSLNILRVIGGADGWYAIEFLTTGTSKAGKKWHCEGVTIVRFTEDKKVAETKMYMDQQHIEKHLDEASDDTTTTPAKK